jgi:hypothetical protein
MATEITALGMPARHRHGVCTVSSFSEDRQTQAVDPTLMALREGDDA